MKKLEFKNFALFSIVIVFAAVIGFSSLASAGSGAQNVDMTSSNDAGDEDQICTANKTYSGCCSGKGGIKDIRGEWIECVDGTYSPSCNGDDVDLSGCCSSRNGVALIDKNRTVICENGTPSPTCAINKCIAK